MGSNGIGKSSWLFNARQRRQHLVGNFLTDVDILLKVLDGFLYRRVGIRIWQLDTLYLSHGRQREGFASIDRLDCATLTAFY
ncbi:MAG: Uncharacterised protein [Halieaceae bacterium]|nr:MAG: Uncharacterised protein [Halieaceae bacterium]